MRRPRLTAVGWWKPGTGLTRVAAEILPRLAASGASVDYVGVGYDGPVSVLGDLRVHPTEFLGRDVYGAHAAAELVRETHPDVVLVFNDLWFMERYHQALAPHLGSAPLLAYFPLDGEIADPATVRSLLSYDVAVVYTDWARSQLRAAFAQLGSGEGPRIEVIGHGVDSRRFRPASELVGVRFASVGRARAKRRVFPELSDPVRSFIVLNANRPSERKRIDLTLEGFARFREGLSAPHRDAVFLCLHQAIRDEAHDAATRRSIVELGLGSRVLLNPFGDGPIDDERLNDLYGACDVGLNTSTGEGWGLVSFEHASAGGRQIVPDHSACSELWREHGILIPVAGRSVFPYSPLRLAEVDPDGVARCLRRAFEQRDGAGVGAMVEWTQNRELGWDYVAARWQELLDDLPPRP